MRTIRARCSRTLRAIAAKFRIVPAQNFVRRSAVDVLYVDSAGRVVGHRQGFKIERFTRL